MRWCGMRTALRLLCLIPCLFVATNAWAQNPYNMMNLIGGIVQSAIMQATLIEWQKIPPAERSCIDEALRERGVSLQSLVQQGIAPFDARLSDMRASCLPTVAPKLSNAHPETTQLNGKGKYIVEGLALDSQVAFNSSVYRSYQCRPSEQYDGLTWCQRKVNEPSPSGPIHSSYTIMHSTDGTALYINRELEPAFFWLRRSGQGVRAPIYALW
jgi:hypothetical protein